MNKIQSVFDITTSNNFLVEFGTSHIPQKVELEYEEDEVNEKTRNLFWNFTSSDLSTDLCLPAPTLPLMKSLFEENDNLNIGTTNLEVSGYLFESVVCPECNKDGEEEEDYYSDSEQKSNQNSTPGWNRNNEGNEDENDDGDGDEQPPSKYKKTES